MSKAILVIDMPSSCGVCDFVGEIGHRGYMRCNNPLSDKYGCDVTDYIGCRADGCYLKPMPERKDKGEGSPAWKMGYNACIDEILGGSE